MQIIKIKYHLDSLPRLQKISKGDWIDLYVAEHVIMQAGEYRLISLGVSLQLPEGYEAHVIPRSSTYKNFGIIQANSFGLIDGSYKGDNDVWMFPAIAMRDTEINIGDRICQFRIMEAMPQIIFEEVTNLDGISRNGFGSTGV